MMNFTKALGLSLMLSCSFAFAADSNFSSDSTTVSTNNSSPAFEWTLERMLMATPMPLTGEERNFLQTHKSLDGIRGWTYPEFKSYIGDELGRKHVVEEASHWQGILVMLQQEAKELSANTHSSPPDCGKAAQPFEGATVERLLNQPNSDAEAKKVFESMQGWRKQIALLAPYVESLRNRQTGNVE